jgi:hypothetical protein
VTDENQRRAPSLGLRDAGQRRCGCHRQATHHQRPSAEHDDIPLVEPFHEASVIKVRLAEKALFAALTAL